MSFNHFDYDVVILTTIVETLISNLHFPYILYERVGHVWNLYLAKDTLQPTKAGLGQFLEQGDLEYCADVAKKMKLLDMNVILKVVFLGSLLLGLPYTSVDFVRYCILFDLI